MVGTLFTKKNIEELFYKDETLKFGHYISCILGSEKKIYRFLELQDDGIFVENLDGSKQLIAYSKDNSSSKIIVLGADI